MELVAEDFKNTEVGIIPSDWSVKEFVEVMDGFSSGQTPYRGRPEFYKGTIPWITSGELNYNIITDTKEKITKEGAKEANLKLIPKGTFLFAITGLEAAGTRGSCAITGIEATTNQSCMALHPKKNVLTTAYLYYYYVRYGNELALKYCQGTKQQSYTGGIAKKLPIILPPTIGEQTAIATALSDTDALINSLEKLIAKKRNIKLGAMQQLLKPKEGWEVKKLGEVATLKARIGWQGLTTAEYKKSGNYYLITGTEFKKGLIDWSKCFFVEKERYVQDKNIQVQVHDVLVTKDGTIGKVAIIKSLPKQATLNSGVFVIRPIKNSFHPLFFYYLLLSEIFQLFLSQLSAGSTINHLYQKDFVSFKFSTPTTIEEQEKIANSLVDMDEEIISLESKLEKYKQIKLGMMQNLLTGKIRLV